MQVVLLKATRFSWNGLSANVGLGGKFGSLLPLCDSQIGAIIATMRGIFRFRCLAQLGCKLLRHQFRLVL